MSRRPLVIDCHGHFTTAPPAHDAWRKAQIEAHGAGAAPPPYPDIPDEAIRAALEPNQLRLAAERGIDLTLFSPRASAMAHHVGDAGVSTLWARHCNDLVHRAVTLYPDRFVGVGMLPQSPASPPAASIAELERIVSRLGFVGVNLNPDPGGGHFASPPLTDRSWYPLYEAMVGLEVPAMIHVSGSCNPALHATGGYYIAADTIAFMQLLEGDLFADFPALTFIIPHGGGAVPYHWGRYRGLADMLGKPGAARRLVERGNIVFDSCVYHQPGIDLLLRVIPHHAVLFGSEMIGAVRGIDPETGHAFDDTLRYIEAADLDAGARHAVLEGNARRVFPRLDRLLAARDAAGG
ncbi:MAG: amidohydrolase family protein [Sphingomonadaceae bacterium]